MFCKTIRAALAAGCALVAHAGGWAPIPADVWAMKEDPAQGIHDAVVLERRLTFTGTAIKHVLRVRILSERGKAAAEMTHFLPETTTIEGRTVQRDGTVTAFDKTKDFTEKTLTYGDGERDLKGVLPPGLTADCVVEMRWVEIATGGSQYTFNFGGREVNTAGDARQIPYSLGHSAEWRLAGPYLTRELVVEFWRAFTWASYVDPGTCKPPETKTEGSMVTYTFRDVPGQEHSPYTLDALSGRPTLHVWTQPLHLANKGRLKPAEYWAEAANMYLRDHYWKNLKRGSSFAALAKELLPGLPPQPAKAGELLLRRLDRKILNLSQPTLEEKARFKKGDERIPETDLEEAASQGRAHARGMTFLFLALADQAGLRPRLAWAKERTHSLLQYGLPDVYQLQHPLVGLALENGGTLWLDPALRFAAPGLIGHAYQGVEAVTMDLATWLPKPEVIPAAPPAFNRASYSYKLEFAQGVERIGMAAGFAGLQEYFERRRYLPNSQEEANRNLKEWMEKNIKDATVSSASVLDAWNPDQNTHWTIQAQRDLPASGSLRVVPFPGMPEPLFLATSWPERRTVPIVMGYLRTHEADCEFKVPQGYVLQAPQAMEMANSFGRVSFNVTTAPGGTVKVHLTVVLARLSAPASAEPELRQYIAWVEEACRKALVLEKA